MTKESFLWQDSSFYPSKHTSFIFLSPRSRFDITAAGFQVFFFCFPWKNVWILEFTVLECLTIFIHSKSWISWIEKSADDFQFSAERLSENAKTSNSAIWFLLIFIDFYWFLLILMDFYWFFIDFYWFLLIYSLLSRLFGTEKHNPISILEYMSSWSSNRNMLSLLNVSRDNNMITLWASGNPIFIPPVDLAFVR